MEAQRYNIYGASNKVNFDHCTIELETEKAYKIKTSEDTFFWVPISVFNKSITDIDQFGSATLSLPFWFSLKYFKL